MNRTREQRAALLAAAEPAELIALADELLADGDDAEVLVAPEVGCVTAQVREPVSAQRFLLGDVLTVRAEVAVGGIRGWAMRLGDDRGAVLAAAVCDARAEGGGRGAAEVAQLCRWIEERIAARDAAEWATLAPTVVEFEELT